MRKSIITSATAAVVACFAALPAAAEAPWEKERPAAMTEHHEVLSQGVLAYLEKSNPIDFGVDPLTIDWVDEFQYGQPISNMTKAQLSELVRGNYYITQSIWKDDSWSVIYYGEDNTSYFCKRLEDGSWVETSLDRHFRKTWAGPGGIIHWDPEVEGAIAPSRDELGWPVIYDGKTGELTEYVFSGHVWRPKTGWLQADYPSVVRENCPELPRVTKENQQQSGETLGEMLKNAKPIRNQPVAFENDNRSPLTMGMLYWYFSPENWKKDL